MLRNKRESPMQGIVLLALFILPMVSTSCATDPGDAVECPECQAGLELLVGVQCVSIQAIEEWGPDGHFHAGECHCYSGQDAVDIEGKLYCLQKECGVTSHEEDDAHHDEDGHTDEDGHADEDTHDENR